MQGKQQNTMGNTRRQGNAKVQSERHLRPCLSSITRWDSEGKLRFDRPPQLKQRNFLLEESNANNKSVLMVKAQSESHLIHSLAKRWQANEKAAGVDLPPALKRASSVGSSARYNASFPLRSRSGDINEPLFVVSPLPPPSPSSSMRSISTSSPNFPSSQDNSTDYKTKDDIITTTSTPIGTNSPSSVISCSKFSQYRQGLVSFLDQISTSAASTCK
jgi:hypothetical protein